MRNSLILTAGGVITVGVFSTLSAAPVQAQSASFFARVRRLTSSINSPNAFINSTQSSNGVVITITNSVTNPPTPAFSSAAANALMQVTAGNSVAVGNVEGISAVIRAGAGLRGLD